MAERIEFVGNPLPTGLPGFGGGTVSVLILPGFNTVVAVQQFGPVVDAPTVTPPDPVAPPGSNPENPTNEVVEPSPAPISGASSNFCKQCIPPKATNPEFALLRTYAAESSCTDCQGTKPGEIDWFEAAGTNLQSGVFHGGASILRGKEDEYGYEWQLDADAAIGLQIGDAGGGSPTDLSCTLTRFKVTVGKTEYRKGPEIFDGENLETYTPQELQVCEGGQTKTWKVLAYKLP